MDAPATNGACDGSYSSAETMEADYTVGDERHKKEAIPAVCWGTKKDEARAEIAMVMQFRGALAAVIPTT